MAAETHFLSGRHVVVAGAGSPSLSFALALRKLWPAYLSPPRLTIFEHDARQDVLGREGYSLSLAGHGDTDNLVSRRDLGLLSKALDLAILRADDTGCFKIWDTDWRGVMSVRLRLARGFPTPGIRIARKHLRRVLINPVSEEVRWGVTCTSTARLETGKAMVWLSRREPSSELSTIECVVADGATNKIRSTLRPNNRLDYAGAVQIATSMIPSLK